MRLNRWNHRDSFGDFNASGDFNDRTSAEQTHITTSSAHVKHFFKEQIHKICMLRKYL